MSTLVLARILMRLFRTGLCDLPILLDELPNNLREDKCHHELEAKICRGHLDRRLLLLHDRRLHRLGRLLQSLGGTGRGTTQIPNQNWPVWC